MSKHVGEALNPRHSTATPNQEGTHNLELFPKEGRVWTPHWLPQHLRSAPERGAPRHRTLKATKTHKSIVKWEIALQGLVQVLLSRSQSRGSQVPGLSVKEAYFLILKLQPEGQNTHPGACEILFTEEASSYHCVPFLAPACQHLSKRRLLLTRGQHYIARFWADWNTPQSFCERGFLAYFHSCGPRGRLVIKHTGRGQLQS